MIDANFKLLKKAKLITQEEYDSLPHEQRELLAKLTKVEVAALISIKRKIPTFDTIVKAAQRDLRSII